jgi:hypothetical protein
MTHFAISENTFFLLSVYDKSKQEVVTDAYISYLLGQLSDQ